MDLLCTPEDEQIIATASDFFSAEFPLDRLRHGRVSDNRRNSEAWIRALEIGLFAGGAPASSSDTGLTLAQMALIFRECGRHLVDPAALGIDLAAFLALECGDFELAQKIGMGTVTVGLTNAIDLAAASEGDAPYHLIDAEGVDLLLVWSENGGALFAAEDFINEETVRGLDGSVPLARARLSVDAKPRLVKKGPALALRARILISAMLVGISEATRDMAVDYAKIREQFGNPIGSYQAIKHFCADMATRAEAAYAQLVYSALSVGNEDAPFQSHSALIVAVNAAELNALKNIQIHGGIGFTAECNAHLFLKRTHLLMRLQGGGSAACRMLLAEPVPMAA